MRRICTRSTAALVLAVLASSVGAVCQAATPEYNVKLLAPLYGNQGVAHAINNAGQIAGSSSYDQYGWQVPTIWTSGIGKSLTGTSPTGAAFAINELGQAAGSLAVLANGSEATYWANGSSIPLGVYGGGALWDTSFALGINDSRQIVGYSRGADWVGRATLWENGSMTALPSLGGIGSWAGAINQSGQIVGWGATAENARHATLWENGLASDLGTLGGTDSAAKGINDLGQVVGHSQTADNSMVVATRWQDGTITELQSLGGLYSSAHAVNLSGLAVGVSDNGDIMYSGRAVLWDGASIMDLNKFLDPTLVAQGWMLNTALDVNDGGYIVGQAINLSTLETRGFLMTPVPEPSTYIMFAIGVGLLLTIQHRMPGRARR